MIGILKNLIPDFIETQFARKQFSGELEAYILFIDLSGFTPLTESLMRKGNSGAEELSLILNDIFSPLVKEVYNRGGFIPYFAGDAFTGIFPVKHSEVSENSALDAAFCVSELFKKQAFTFRGFNIGIKIGMASGTITWGIVGRNFKSFYFRGDPIDNSSNGFMGSKEHDILIHRSYFEKCKDIPQIKITTLDQNYAQLDFNGYQPVVSNLSIYTKDDIAGKAKSLFLPSAILDYDQEGEFRTVISTFISFTGVENHELLNQFASVVIDQMVEFSGYFKEIEFGDKGGVMVGFFGAPVSFENNVERALEFVASTSEILQEFQKGNNLKFRVGLTQGMAYTGIVGGKERCQYAIVGNYVNLAARLMMYADWNEVLVSEQMLDRKQFKFEHRGNIKYKGVKGNIPTYRLAGRNYENRPAFSGPMVGRDKEIEQLEQFIGGIIIGNSSGVVHIYGEAGVGKSRSVFELRKQLESENKLRWLSCQADQILKKPFNPFLKLIRNYFDQSPNQPKLANHDNFETKFQSLIEALYEIQTPQSEQILRELLRTKSILAARIGLSYKHSLWDQLDEKGRYQNTITAIVFLLLAESLRQPLVIELEDGHWLDDNSKELLQELVKRLGNTPIALLITSRYLDDGEKPTIIKANGNEKANLRFLEIDLQPLTADSIRDFAEIKLKGAISEEFFGLLIRIGNNNPFYIEQILEYFKENDLLLESDDGWNIKDENIKLSNSINAILTARIDRLSAVVKETVKAASVIGREFEVHVLSEVMKDKQFFKVEDTNVKTLVNEQIKAAERGQIWMARNELRYIFKNSLLREAAYSMQLNKRLEQLHRMIAEAIERLYANSLEERYVDLAFHYEQANIFDKTCEYLRKAADFARSNYQVQQALDYYEKLLSMLGQQKDHIAHIQTYLKKGKVLEIIGNWEQGKLAYEEALKLAKRSRDIVMLGRANNHLGHLLMLRGEYPQASSYLQTALGLFDSIDEQNDIIKVYGDLGNINFRQGHYEEAKSYFQQSIDLSLELNNQSIDAQIIANLGLTHMNQGSYEAGIETILRQVLYYEENSDKASLAILYTNLGIVYFEKGDYDAALKSYQKGLVLSEELGNKQLTTIAIGSIGSVYERKGDYKKAMAHFEKDLELSEELGDKQGIAIALGLIGELLSYQGEFHKAIEYLQKNLMISREIGYKKGTAKALNTLGDVFYYIKQYDRSIGFYDEAIKLTREIGNKLVLGFSLAEKGAVLIAKEDRSGIEEICKESLELAQELGNPDLLFEAEWLITRKTILMGELELATQSLEKLLDQYKDADQKAKVYFELALLFPENKDYKEKALHLLQELYKATPKYIYMAKVEELTSNSNTAL